MRNQNGQFKKGHSGNPSGRPSSNLAEVRRVLAGQGADVAKKVLEAALDGDMSACKLVLERICPALKPRLQDIEFDEPLQESPTGIAQQLLAAAMKGGVSPEAASQLVNSVGVLSRIIETEELKGRIEALERVLKSNKK